MDLVREVFRSIFHPRSAATILGCVCVCLSSIFQYDFWRFWQRIPESGAETLCILRRPIPGIGGWLARLVGRLVGRSVGQPSFFGRGGGLA